MPIEFPCPSCQRLMRTPDGSGGKKGRCPQCGTVSEIPQIAPRPAESAAAAPDSRWRRSAEPAPVAGAEPAKIEFACPHCGSSVRTPRSAAGKKGRCPSCQQLVDIPAMEQPVAQRPPKPAPTPKPVQPQPKPKSTPAAPTSRPSAAPASDRVPGLVPLDVTDTGLVPLETPGLQPLANDPLADPLSSLEPMAGGGTAANPFADSYPPAAPAPSSMSLNPYRSPTGYTKRKPGSVSPGVVMAPAIAMLVVAGLSMLVMIPYTILVAIGNIASAGIGDSPERIGYAVGTILGVALVIGVHVLVLVGAYRMLKFESWGTALTAAILLIVPCTVCWIGLPFGIWATVVLSLADVRRQFR